MPEVYVSAVIGARLENVWEVLRDFDAPVGEEEATAALVTSIFEQGFASIAASK